MHWPGHARAHLLEPPTAVGSLSPGGWDWPYCINGGQAHTTGKKGATWKPVLKNPGPGFFPRSPTVKLGWISEHPRGLSLQAPGPL